ncbi:hypothetical protein ACP70R_038870 [Stipagrostis hirtigluma subsp. patula]
MEEATRYEVLLRLMEGLYTDQSTIGLCCLLSIVYVIVSIDLIKEIALLTNMRLSKLSDTCGSQDCIFTFE